LNHYEQNTSLLEDPYKNICVKLDDLACSYSEDLNISLTYNKTTVLLADL